MDWDYAEKAVREMAKFHALSFAFERELPDTFEKSVKVKNEFVFSSGSASEQETEMYQEGLVKSILEVTSPENLGKLKKFLEQYTKDMWKQQFSQLRRSILTHGDYRHSNILIKKEEGKITSLIPVDYQTVYYGCPANDLIYFIFTGSDRRFRTNYYEKLLGHYHKCLGDFLALLDLNVSEVYPEEDFYLDMKDRTIFALFLGIFILPYILVEKKPEFSGKIEEFKVQQSATFRERFNGILQDCIDWDLL
ncbi:hypothetical protein EVAR_25737_1 [Eumeta japonica]|uniref:CHK kinase-like domain-containing protein n=1 Tax=Eumeta variegata TaxID=151549 RepID=A0A4C1V7D5_EUMVA|nr:hypothetical protein EVAR_25737_1 [Eumeta japonica]